MHLKQAALSALVSYYLVKIVPYWGLSLIATTVLFFVPLIYNTNQELIDHQLKQAGDVINAQTAQIRDVANKHTAQATEITSQYVHDATAKAQQMLRGSTPKPAVPKESDFPKAPKEEPEEEEEEEESEAEDTVKREQAPLIAA
jgi:hypothetical protein